MTPIQQLSIVDGAFLHLESAEMPMHVGSLALYDPPESAAPGSWLDSVRSHISARIHLAPVFTRKLATLPLALANPVWTIDAEVDLEYHVRHHLLPRPGSIAQIEALTARLHASLLDRSRPLWEFHVIEGLADGRLGLYSKLHHAAVDGQAAIALAATIFDPTPEPRDVKPPAARRSKPAQPGTTALLGASLSNQWLQLRRFVKLLAPLAGAALASASTSAVSRAERPRGSASRLKLAPITPFNDTITNRRVFAAVELPMARLKAIGKAHGASINDMVIWLSSTALRAYLLEGRELPERTLVAGVPISLRAEGDTSSNNQVSMTLIDLATEVADPLQRLAAITGATRTMKGEIGRFGDLIPKDFPSLGAPWLLGGLASLYGRTSIANRLRIINLVISNVPGPRQPMYLAGARLTGMFPLSIVVHGVGLNITVQSCLDQLCFGLVACRRAVPDVKRLAGHLQWAMDVAGSLPEPASAREAAAPPAQPQRPARKRSSRAAGGATAGDKKPAAAAAPNKPARRAASAKPKGTDQAANAPAAGSRRRRDAAS